MFLYTVPKWLLTTSTMLKYIDKVHSIRIYKSMAAWYYSIKCIHTHIYSLPSMALWFSEISKPMTLLFFSWLLSHIAISSIFFLIKAFLHTLPITPFPPQPKKKMKFTAKGRCQKEEEEKIRNKDRTDYICEGK